MPPRFPAVQIFCMLKLCTPFYFFVQPRTPATADFSYLYLPCCTLCIHTFRASAGRGDLRGRSGWPLPPSTSHPPLPPLNQPVNLTSTPTSDISALCETMNFRAVGLGSTCHLKIGIPKQRFTMLWRKNLVLIVFNTYLLASKVKSSATPTNHGRLLVWTSQVMRNETKILIL